MSLADEIISGAIAHKDQTKSFFFYGIAGGGKTTTALLHPGKRKLLIDVDEKYFEMELQIPGLDVWQPKVPLGGNAIQFTQVDPTRKNPYVGTKIESRPGGYDRICEIINQLAKDCPYDVVIFDSLTRLMAHLEYLVMYTHNVSTLTETLYGVIKRNIIEFIHLFQRLPCDRILIAHDKEVKNEEGGVIGMQPNLTGAFARDSIGYFTEAYRFTGRSALGEFKIQTLPSSFAPARTAIVQLKQTTETVIDPKIIFAGRG